MRELSQVKKLVTLPILKPKTGEKYDPLKKLPKPVKPPTGDPNKNTEPKNPNKKNTER